MEVNFQSCYKIPATVKQKMLYITSRTAAIKNLKQKRIEQPQINIKGYTKHMMIWPQPVDKGSWTGK